MKFEQGDSSLVNWLKRAGHQGYALRDTMIYDKGKTVRLAKLKEIIQFPGNEALYVNGEDFLGNSVKLKSLCLNKKYCFRIAPKADFAGHFEVVKKYGLTVRELIKFLQDKFSYPSNIYEIRVTKYTESVNFSAVVLVSRQGVIGEVVNGDLYHLTYDRPLNKGQFITRFFLNTKSKKLICQPSNALTVKKIKKLLSFLMVSNKINQKKLRRVGFKINYDYIAGYYEYVADDKVGVFTDMNNKKITTNFKFEPKLINNRLSSKIGLMGTPIQVYKGGIQGRAQWINDNNVKSFKAGNILVCQRTSVNYLPAMKKAKAIITCSGGIMSHAAIIARELGIPCVVGVVNAKRIKNRKKLSLELQTGKITILDK